MRDIFNLVERKSGIFRDFGNRPVSLEQIPSNRGSAPRFAFDSTLGSMAVGLGVVISQSPIASIPGAQASRLRVRKAASVTLASFKRKQAFSLRFYHTQAGRLRSRDALPGIDAIEAIAKRCI